MEFSTAKALAVIGAALGLVGSFVGHGALGLLGLILYLLGLYHVSRAYASPEIFTYALISSVGAAVVAVGGLLVVASLLSLIGAANAATAAAALGLGAAVLLLTVLYGAVLLMGHYKKRLMEALAPYSDRSLAGLTGKLYWIGAILTIIIIGLVIVLIAAVLEIIVLSGLREPGEAAVKAAGEKRGEWSTPW